MKRYFFVCALLLAGSSAALPESHLPPAVPPQPQGKPVARVNGAVLTDRDLLREMYAIFPYARVHNGGFPQAMEADIRKGALKMIVFEELVYQEALRRKLTVPPAKMQRAMADFRKQFSTDAEFQSFLKTDLNGSRELLRAKVRRSLLIEQMLKTEVTSKALVSVLEAKVYYDKNRERFKTPESFSLQTISILPPPNANPAQLLDVRKRAEEALRQSKTTKSYEEFGMLAEKISEDDYRVVMGDHKSVDRTKLPPQVVQAALAMKPGEMSGLIQVDEAFTVIRLNAHSAPGMQKFAAVKDDLAKQLEKIKTEQLRSGLDKKLRATAKVEEL
jgi:peptidylprolyl isomerase